MIVAVASLSRCNLLTAREGSVSRYFSPPVFVYFGMIFLVCMIFLAVKELSFSYLTSLQTSLGILLHLVKLTRLHSMNSLNNSKWDMVGSFIKQVIINEELNPEELKNYIKFTSVATERFLCVTVSESVLWLSSTEHKALVRRAVSVCDFLCCAAEHLPMASQYFRRLYAFIKFRFAGT